MGKNPFFDKKGDIAATTIDAIMSKRTRLGKNPNCIFINRHLEQPSV